MRFIAVEIATVAYGLGNWPFDNGKRARAEVYFRRIVAERYWPVSCFIAAETELVRMGKK